MKGLWSGKRFGVLFAILLTAFTAYALLDTFVLPRQYEAVVPLTLDASTDAISGSDAGTSGSADGNRKGRRPRGDGDGAFPGPRGRTRDDGTESKASASDESSETGVIGTYADESVSIEVTRRRVGNTDVYVADVTLSSPERLKTALANNVYGRNVKDKTSAIAAANNAIFAVNGDYYGARNSGYVIRNGVLYRDAAAGGDVLAIFADGSFQIADDREVTAQELLDAGAVQVLSFGPALVKDGVVAVTEGEEVGRAMADNPRTAVGVAGGLRYFFVVADGRTSESEGMSLHELAELMRDLGAKTAYNLDGGGSSTMVFQGEVVNRPTTNGNSVQERSVSDIVYIGA